MSSPRQLGIRLALAAGLTTATVFVPPAAHAAIGFSWNTVGTIHGMLNGVATIPGDPADVWVVGSTPDTETGRMRAFVGHGSWPSAPVPAGPADPDIDVELRGVDYSGSAVWAVGRAGDGTRIERYDPTDPASGGRVEPSPSPAPGSMLSGVDMLRPDDGWAVGSAGPDTLILHWDGTIWAQAPSPFPGRLTAVTALAADDVWAAGAVGTTETLVLHWDGGSWTRIPSPDPATGANVLLSVAVARGELWAVGYGSTDPTDRDETGRRAVALRWNGSAWQMVRPWSESVTEFTGATVAADGTLTLACYVTVDGVETACLEPWDGTALHHQVYVPLSPANSHVATALEAVAAGSDGSMWAVGWWRLDPGEPTEPAVLGMRSLAP